MDADGKGIEFLQEHHLCVVATVMPDGMPHVAVKNYAITENPTVVFLSMDNRSVTVQNALTSGKMAVVVGWSEEHPVTLQMRGEVHLATSLADLAAAKTAYYTKYPYSQQFENDPHTVFLAFTPQWLRFSNVKADPSLYDFFKRGIQMKRLREFHH